MEIISYACTNVRSSIIGHLSLGVVGVVHTAPPQAKGAAHLTHRIVKSSNHHLAMPKNLSSYPSLEVLRSLGTTRSRKEE